MAPPTNGCRGLIEWRREHLIRIGFDDRLYRHPALQWAQANFVHVQMMVEDRYFYDAETGRYTVDRYLDDLEARFGGVDSVLIWYIYPNIGVDDRSQFDLAHALPGGVGALKGVVDDFHRRGVRVFLPTMAWDNGTRDGGATDWDRMIELVMATGADGVNGDTYSGVPLSRFKRRPRRGAGRSCCNPNRRRTRGDHHLPWNVQSWTKRIPNESIPTVVKLKWLEPRHMINIENRWSRDRIHDLQHAFFNGIGYVAWENVFGCMNLFTERDGEALRRVATVQRRFAPLFVGPDWRPYEKTLQAGVFASRWPGEGRTLWTLVNRQEYAIGGEQLSCALMSPARPIMTFGTASVVEPRIDGDRAVLSAATSRRNGFAAFLCDATGEDLGDYLATMAQACRQRRCSDYLADNGARPSRTLVPDRADPPLRGRARLG